MRAWIGAAALLAAASFASGALAQAPGWAVGSWRGSLEGYRNDPGGPDRVLIVDSAGKCRWDYVSKAAQPAPAKSCSFTGDSMELLTGGSSAVKLKLTDGRLKGSFTPSAGGKPFFLTMSK